MIDVTRKTLRKGRFLSKDLVGFIINLNQVTMAMPDLDKGCGRSTTICFKCDDLEEIVETLWLNRDEPWL